MIPVTGDACNNPNFAGWWLLGMLGILNKEASMLTIVGILIVLWILGLIAHVGGGLIHLLLVIALVLFIYNLITGRRAV
jgi:hypothetical protein